MVIGTLSSFTCQQSSGGEGTKWICKNDDNKWILDAQEPEKLAVNYFKTLYSLENVDTDIHGLPMRGFVRLTSQDHTTLNRPFSAEEVEIAVTKMGSFKAS